MTVEEAQNFVDSGMLGGGMLPKLQNCINAIKTAFPGCISWTDEFLTACCWKSLRIKGIGTAIIIPRKMRGIIMAE